jgi:hypothetical protein
VSAHPIAAAKAIFFTRQGAASVVQSICTSKPQRGLEEKWPRPKGLRPKNTLAALLVVHLVLLNLSPRALP